MPVVIAGETGQSDAKQLLVDAFKAGKVSPLAAVRGSLHRALRSPFPQLRVLESSLNVTVPDIQALRREVLNTTLRDLASLGAHAEQLLDLLRDVSLLAFVFRSVVQIVTPQSQERRCVTILSDPT